MQTLVRIYKVARWFALLALIVVIVLAIQKPALPTPQSAEEQKANLQEFEAKLRDLEVRMQTGQGGEALQLSEPEVNAALANSVETARSTAAAESSEAPEVKDWRVSFGEDEVTGYLTTELYGKEVCVTVSGRLGAEDGYATFTPTGFKVGDLSVPVSMVEPALQKKLAEPETHEKLRLPEFVGDLRVEKGQLVITPR